MAWRLAKSLDKLREQINTDFPKRSKLSDGSIGDARHSASKSDHNPNGKGVVCAIDITNDPANGLDCNKLSAALAKSKDPRIKYLIWNRQICSSTKSPWEWRHYSGSNPHNKHLHISVNSKYDDTDAWKINLDAKLPAVHPDPELVEFGDQGFAVTKLQTKLAELGYLRQSDIDGIFGKDVKEAVIEFQKKNGLDPDGIAGKDTWGLLDSEKSASTAEFVGNLKISRKSFFDGFRAWRKTINQKQVNALEFLLTSFENDHIWKDVRHISYALATMCVETGWTFEPITEKGGASYFKKYDGRQSLGNFKAGDGARFKGRGYVQITGRRNYTYFEKELGIDLTVHPEKALDPKTSFLIMTIGMFRGTFTGKDLGDFINAAKCDYKGARAIINGKDRDSEIAGYAKQFESILTASVQKASAAGA